MTSFTVVNLKELEDGAAARSPQLEARFARSHLDSDHLGVSYFRYGPGYRGGMGHHHREQEEAYVVVRGSGRVKVDNDIVELRQWDAIRFDVDTMRDMEGGPDGMEYVAFGAGEDPRDAEMAQGWWVDPDA